MKANKGKLIILSGPSGVGKGTVREIFWKETDLHLSFSVSSTTRKPRPGEVDGVEYYFIDREQFQQKINNNDFLEYAEFAHNLYGTLIEEVEKKTEAGFNVVMEIEQKGALDVIEKVPEAITLFITPPSIEELRKRLTERRTNTPEDIEKRLAVAEYEIEVGKKYYKHLIVNDDADRCAKEIVDIIRKEQN